MSHFDYFNLPTAEQLLSTDFTPADNQLQRLVIPLLEEILHSIWSGRNDFFFGVNMGYYYDPTQPTNFLVPDAFLSLGVEKFKSYDPKPQGRLCYVIWEENYVVPKLVIESVSQIYRGEYDNKMLHYADIGVLYYVIYDGDRYYSDDSENSKGDSFEVYRNENGLYVRQPGEPVWMPEIGLGIGRERGCYCARTREWLYWYDQQGKKYITPSQIVWERIRIAQEIRRLKELARQNGIDPDEFFRAD